MELKEAKRELERNGYQRKLMYRLSYQKDDTWKCIYFDDKEEADMMVDAMMKVNSKVRIYHFISVNTWSWEVFIEP